MITGINESKTLTKYISCEYKYKFGRRNCNSDQWWNNYKCSRESKKREKCEKEYIWNSAACNCENGKHLASIMEDSAIMCDEIIESYEEEKKINEKKQSVISIFYLHFLIAVSIYRYLIKNGGEQKHSFRFHFKNNKLKEIIH